MSRISHDVKSKAGGWLYVIAVLGVAAVLFLPLHALDASFPPLPKPRLSFWFSLLTWVLAASVFWSFRVRFWPRDSRECRRFDNVICLVVLQAVLLRVAFESSSACAILFPAWLPQATWLWIPWFLIPGLTGILLGGRFGVLVCLTGGLMLYLLADPGPWPFMGCLTSPLVGILSLRRSPARNRVLRAGTATGGTLAIITGIHYAMHGAAMNTLVAAILAPLLVSFLSAFLVLAVLPVLEWMLGELSDVTLTEYGTDHRLLDELRTKAPGTWHHSLNVADLAERAATDVGARALFCKTAALYHDIGKLYEPHLFAENSDGPCLINLNPSQRPENYRARRPRT